MTSILRRIRQNRLRLRLHFHQLGYPSFQHRGDRVHHRNHRRAVGYDWDVDEKDGRGEIVIVRGCGNYQRVKIGGDCST